MYDQPFILDIVNLLIVVVLVAITAFFVASEYAIVKLRISRIDQLIAVGNKAAIAAKKITSNLEGYLSACQLGITITALGLGWIGVPKISSLLHPLFNHLNINDSIGHVLSFVIAFLFITHLNVVIGELVPKTVAIYKAESITLFVARPLLFFYRLMFPFIWILNGTANLLVRLLGLKPASEHEHTHTEEELRTILSESYKSGEINHSEFKYANRIFEFDDRIAKEIMVPRTEIMTTSVEKTFQEI